MSPQQNIEQLIKFADQIRAILKIVGHTEDELDRLVQVFLHKLEIAAMGEIEKGMSKEQLAHLTSITQQFENEMSKSDKDGARLDEITTGFKNLLQQAVTPKQMAQSYEKAITDLLEDYLKTIKPHLSKEQWIEIGEVLRPIAV